jgi:hypothetical protein
MGVGWVICFLDGSSWAGQLGGCTASLGCTCGRTASINTLQGPGLTFQRLRLFQWSLCARFFLLSLESTENSGLDMSRIGAMLMTQYKRMMLEVQQVISTPE